MGKKRIRRMVIWFLATTFFIFLVFNVIGFIISAPKYTGEPSGHFNGKTFENPGKVKAKGLGDVLKWSMNRKKQPWEEERDIVPGPKPEERVDAGIKITFINHSTFLIQVDGKNIVTDPIWSDRASPVQFAGPKRMRPPGIAFDDLPEIDYVIISHNHYDHLDVKTMKRIIERFDPQVITPLGVGKFIQRMGSSKTHDMDWWEEIKLEGGLRIASVPAQHFSGRGTFDRDATLWCGYVILSEEGNIYFAGDTGLGDFFHQIGERYGGMKVSLIPIGAYIPRWFMSPVHISPEEAVQVHQNVRSEQSIAMHFGTFPLADEGRDQPVLDLKEAILKAGLQDVDFLVMEEGQSIIF